MTTSFTHLRPGVTYFFYVDFPLLRFRLYIKKIISLLSFSLPNKLPLRYSSFTKKNFYNLVSSTKHPSPLHCTSLLLYLFISFYIVFITFHFPEFTLSSLPPGSRVPFGRPSEVAPKESLSLTWITMFQSYFLISHI